MSPKSILEEFKYSISQEKLPTINKERIVIND